MYKDSNSLLYNKKGNNMDNIQDKFHNKLKELINNFIEDNNCNITFYTVYETTGGKIVMRIINDLFFIITNKEEDNMDS